MQRGWGNLQRGGLGMIVCSCFGQFRRPQIQFCVVPNIFGSMFFLPQGHSHSASTLLLGLHVPTFCGIGSSSERTTRSGTDVGQRKPTKALFFAFWQELHLYVFFF